MNRDAGQLKIVTEFGPTGRRQLRRYRMKTSYRKGAAGFERESNKIEYGLLVGLIAITALAGLWTRPAVRSGEVASPAVTDAPATDRG